MIGDSLTWRGGDELARLRPSFTLDGEPARKLTALRERLDALPGQARRARRVIIELGTSPAKSFKQRDLTRIVRSLPAGTDLMLVLPYYQLRTDPVVVSKSSTQVSAWMRSLARSRKHACVADWPAYVAVAPGHPPGRRTHRARRRGPVGAMDLPAVGTLLSAPALPGQPRAELPST